ncbi:MAG: DUF2116 family Zn-ribbon domain-containing protein [Euryarchaeota archaeon]|nr:DUF2116 family Zn-ribbon domain-containing protein [Euryarchaeota archaeon]
MGRMEERLKKAVQVTAGATKGVISKISDNPKSSKYVAPHRHCVICHTPVPLEADPAHCGAEECSTKHARREKSRKRLQLMMYLFPAIAIMLFILPFVTS